MKNEIDVYTLLICRFFSFIVCLLTVNRIFINFIRVYFTVNIMFRNSKLRNVLSFSLIIGDL